MIGLPIHKVRFCFSINWKAPLIPLVELDQSFIDQRNSELNECFGKLEESLRSIDTSSNKGYDDLLKAVHVVEELRRYKFQINKTDASGKDNVPYTTSHQGKV